jgi:hypothetical protein
LLFYLVAAEALLLLGPLLCQQIEPGQTILLAQEQAAACPVRRQCGGEAAQSGIIFKMRIYMRGNETIQSGIERSK